MSSVAVIDYGMGNLHSIAKALQHADSGTRVEITANPQQIMDADRVVFPGVGAMRDCMQALTNSGLANVIQLVADNKPLLGICLGMQALLSDSEENSGVDCLNLIPGHVRRFDDHMTDESGNVLKIPHMGWNQVQQCPHPLWEGIQQGSRFYFVHSYYAVADDAHHSIATTDYPTPFTCALAKNKIFAVQFHPEKSQTVGLQLLKNFLHWDGTL